MQLLQVTLDPRETVIAEAGAMVFMEQDINFSAKMGDGSGGVVDKLFGIGKRWLTGESLFFTHFQNQGRVPRSVGFAAPYPGSIIPLDLAQLDGEVICQKTAFLAAALGVQVDIALTKRLSGGFFGGEGFVLQRLRGDGMAFIHAGGAVVRKQLRDETLRLETGCLVAFSGDIDYGVALSGGLKSMMFGGEGMFLATLSGSGFVWIQSLPFSRMAERVMAYAEAHEDNKG